MQVADRWHIAHNLADALERMAVRVLVQLHKQRAVDDLAGQEQRAPPAIPGPVLRLTPVANSAQVGGHD